MSITPNDYEIMRLQRRKKVQLLVIMGYNITQIQQQLKKDYKGEWSYNTIAKDIRAQQHEIDTAMKDLGNIELKKYILTTREIFHEMWKRYQAVKKHDSEKAANILDKIWKNFDKFIERLQRLGMLPYNIGKMEVSEKKLFFAMMAEIQELERQESENAPAGNPDERASEQVLEV